MRILFIGFNAKYINPTNQLIPRLLKLFADVVFYGTGFVNDSILNLGVLKFVDEHGPFDFIATTSQLVIDSDSASIEDFYRRYSLLQWGNASIPEFVGNAKNYMRSCEIPKVCFALDLDTYGLSPIVLDQLDRFSDYIVGCGDGFYRPLEELPYTQFEKSFKRSVAKGIPLGLWYDFCRIRRHKFINVAHFVGLHEFDFSATAGRSNDASVVGQLYHSRALTLSLLKSNKKLRVVSSSYRFIFSLLDKLGYRPYSRLIPHVIYRALFKQALCKSKISITDGSAHDHVIRKFVEIPASGALLLARPCTGFESLGFRDGESAVILDESDPAGQVLKLLSDPERLQAIASKGQEVVWRNHSISARSQQIEKALNRILEGRFVGSIWRDGAFVLL